jgi:error-prone DNA polymerase
MSFAELVCVSNFSFQRGASRPAELVHQAKELGYNALAITDECSLAGIVRAHEAAKEANLKLIVGSQFTTQEGDRLVLLAPDHAAYTQLCELITRARRAATKGKYVITRCDFENGPGTTKLDACIALLITSPNQTAAAEWFASLPFAIRGLACIHTLSQSADKQLAESIELAQRLNLIPVATNDTHYHVRVRRALHDVITAIRLGTTVDKVGKQGFANGERHLRSIATLEKLFPPELIKATVAIAEQCSFSLDQLHYEYPHELVPAGETPASYLRKLTEEGARRRWPNGTPIEVRQNIDKELALIADLKYEHYFLTVEDIVRFARSKNILCQGRGSAANSSVCYALHVTEVDTSRISMLFERFISKERAEPPDIDIDFEHQRREEVIQYIYGKYGRARTALAATVICYRRRMAVRDVGKALGFAPDIVDALAKSLQWFDDGSSLPDELAKVGFDPNSLLARQLLALVKEILGFPRHLSQHVGGFVISEHPLSTLVPLENAAMPKRTIIQWDKEDLESLKLLKVDCLALGMLSAIRRALEMVSQRRQQPFTMQDVPAEDPATYDMLCRGESIGVFQVESRAQMTMLPRLKPRCYYDIVTQVAIIRPGPIQGGMVHPYLRRRQGLEKIDYPSPELEAVLSRTYGVPLFQEQVMQIAMVAAGFTAGEADQVRRSMAAWQRRGGLDHFRDKLLNGMREKGYTQEFALRIYEQILGFGSYGFPESHAASFALLAYVSSWLRCHEPAAFCAGLLNSQPMGFYAPAQLIADAKRNRVEFRPVDVTISDWDCGIEMNSERRADVRLGMRLISGLTEPQATAIVNARSAQPFADVNDLAHRANLNRRALNLLARSGALRSLTTTRPHARWKALGVQQLPGLLAGREAMETDIALPALSEGKEAVEDYKSLGFTLGRHPLALLRPRLNRLRVRRADELPLLSNGTLVRVAGIVTHRQRPETAAGVIFISLEDETGMSNLIIWPKILQAQRSAVLGSKLMIVRGELQNEQGVIHVVARVVKDYSHLLGELNTSSRDFH